MARIHVMHIIDRRRGPSGGRSQADIARRRACGRRRIDHLHNMSSGLIRVPVRAPALVTRVVEDRIQAARDPDRTVQVTDPAEADRDAERGSLRL